MQLSCALFVQKWEFLRSISYKYVYSVQLCVQLMHNFWEVFRVNVQRSVQFMCSVMCNYVKL